MNRLPRDKASYLIHQVARQDERYPKALEDEYARVDDSTFEELLAYSAELSSLFNFYNLQLKQQGNWSSLFKRSEIAIMAEIVSYCSIDIEKNNKNSVPLNLTDKAQSSYNHAVILDQWFRRLKSYSSQAGMVLANEIESIVKDKLTTEVHRLGFLLEVFSSQLQVQCDQAFSDFDRIWKFGLSKDDLFPYSLLKQPFEKERLPYYLDGIYLSIISRMTYLKSLTATQLIQSLSSQHHDPTISLFITFLTLYQKVQAKLNTFASKHRDYYYLDLLGIEKEQTNRDLVVLFVEPKKQLKQVIINDGDQFKVEPNKGESNYFVSKTDYLISQTRVEQLFTLYLERDNYISPEYLFNYVTRIKRNNILQQVLSSDEAVLKSWPLFGHNSSSFKTVGFDADIGFAIASNSFQLQEGKREITLQFELAEKDVSSATINHILIQHDENKHKVENQLVAKENNRCLILCFNVLGQTLSFKSTLSFDVMVTLLAQEDIDLFFHHDIKTQKKSLLKYFFLTILEHSSTVEGYFFAMGKIFNRQLLSKRQWLTQDELEQIFVINRAKANQPNFQDVPFKAMNKILTSVEPYDHSHIICNAFSVKITTESGWTKIDNQQLILVKSAKGCFKFNINIQLSSGDESVVDYQKDIHGDNFQLSLPVLKLTLNSNANIYAYSLFADFNLAALTIDTCVTGLTSFVAFNQHGQIDSSKPFNVFGPIPSKNSYLMVGSYEPARKNITELLLNIKWGNLPSEPGGFYRYFYDYDLLIDNDSFKLSQSILTDGQWKFINHIDMFSMSKKELLSVKKQMIYSTEETIIPIREHVTEDDFNHFEQVKNGFYKFVLTEPSFAFCHDIFPRLMSSIMTQNIKLKVPKTLPQKPFTPIIESLSIDYKSTERIDFNLKESGNKPNQSQFIHCHGNGNTLANKLSKDFIPSILPDLCHDGFLYIGLSATAIPTTLSLYFQLLDDSSLAVKGSIPEISWAAYTSSGWRLLSGSNILFDSTASLTSAGIITLSLPHDMAIDNSASPSHLYWLRLSVKEGVENFASIVRILANCIEVERVQHSNSQNTIGSKWLSVEPIKGLKHLEKVVYHQSSHLQSDKRQLITSTSELLRHKKRLVTSWDYEHYILNEFPELHMVKCFSNLTTDSVEPKPGHILIVVVPKLKGAQTMTDRVLADTTLLREIYYKIKPLSSEFVTIEVTNPHYERIQVRCSVLFNNPILAGKYCQKLNVQLSEYFSAWKSHGKAILFGWQLTCEEVIAYILQQPNVTSVTNFSILHISEYGQKKYLLNDTVAMKKDNVSIIKSNFPWCLPLPDKMHSIDVLSESEIQVPDITGINEMQIGNNFIVGG